MRRTLIILLLSISSGAAGRNEPASVDAPYNKVFDPWRACIAAEALAKRGAPDALRTCFLAAYVRVNQPFLGGEDFYTMNKILREVLTVLGDEKFSRALRKERPEIRSAVRWHIGSDPQLKKCPQTAKALREAPTIDWPVERAYRNDR